MAMDLLDGIYSLCYFQCNFPQAKIKVHMPNGEVKESEELPLETPCSFISLRAAAGEDWNIELQFKGDDPDALRLSKN